MKELVEYKEIQHYVKSLVLHETYHDMTTLPTLTFLAYKNCIESCFLSYSGALWRTYDK